MRLFGCCVIRSFQLAELKGKLYQVEIMYAFLYGTECLPLKNSLEQNMYEVEIITLRWMCVITRMDWIKNKDVREKLGVTPLSEKMKTC